MRPGNYAHEKWAELSPLVTCYKNRAKGKWYRCHKDSNGIYKTICLTQAQARLYDAIMESMIEGTLELTLIPFNTKTLEILISKHELFTLTGGILKVV